MIFVQKQTLRSRMAAELRRMDPAARAAASQKIAERLAALMGTQRPGMLLGFAPLESEPDWTGAWPPDRAVALPRVDGEHVRYYPVEGLAGLVSGRFGIPEPEAISELEVALPEAVVILVPGVAFDRSGCRLGRGKGFYDRLLADSRLSAIRVGVCFARQLVERVPVEPHDRELDVIVTEAGTIECRR